MTELEEEPSILIENCYEVKEDGTLVPFPRLSQQRDVFLTSDNIFTILDPMPELLESYENA